MKRAKENHDSSKLREEAPLTDDDIEQIVQEAESTDIELEHFEMFDNNSSLASLGDFFPKKKKAKRARKAS